MVHRARITLAIVSLAVVATQARADDQPVGHAPTAWERKGFDRPAAMAFAARYVKFVGANKSARETVGAAIGMAKKAGFRRLWSDEGKPGGPRKLAAGAKVYADVHGKLAAFAVIGKQPLDRGVHVVAAHIDSVRIDLKQRPLYADGNVALLETHYYGGIKSYHWLSQPLELRGVVVKQSGEVVRIAIGDDPDEPVLVIPDVAPHVYAPDREEGEDIPGEKLDAVFATTPARSPAAGVDPYAAEAARLLAAEYGITVADLVSAELELVPASSPRDVGIDRAAIGGYGHDDRACAYAALRALLDAKRPEHTAIVVLVDKEETGSTGTTGARSRFLRRFVAELLAARGETATGLAVDRVLAASFVFSADVTGAINPLYADLYDPKNNAFLGGGVAWDRSGIHAEVLGYVRTLFDRAGVTHQAASWTKVGKSGGGTVLSYFTRHGMDGIDVAIPVLSMHSTFEIVSKADLYEGYRAYKAFLLD